MAQHPEEPLTTDAQILARLRRPARERAAETTRDEPDRADAIKRLVDPNAPKAPMSSYSKTLREFRSEMAETAYAAMESSKDDELDAALLEARGDAQEQSRVNHDERERETTTAKPTPRLRLATRADDARDANAQNILVANQLCKGYVKGKKLIPVLRGVDLAVRQGELLAVVGQSGSGKSTLLHLLGTLDTPDSGTIYFDGQRIDNLPINQRDVLRNHYIGMIFQFYHLLPELTTLENVLAPLMIRHSALAYFRQRAGYVDRAKEILDLVGLSHRLKHKPNELSGGEMQRASIARALMTNPRVLLADEPTGNLDSKASSDVLELLRTLNREQGLTIVMVTHDMSQARDADRAIRLVDGAVYHEE